MQLVQVLLWRLAPTARLGQVTAARAAATLFVVCGLLAVTILDVALSVARRGALLSLGRGR
jgi:hypothetical protein